MLGGRHLVEHSNGILVQQMLLFCDIYIYIYRERERERERENQDISWVHVLIVVC